MSSVAPCLAGQRLSERFRLAAQPLRPGEIGRALVFAAEDESTGRPVIVKVYREEDAAALGREEEALGRLERAASPRFAQRIAGGEVRLSDRSFGYLAFERAPGAPLDLLLGTGFLGLHERLEIAYQLVEALAAVHAVGVVHGDVKPANVIVSVRETDSVRPADYVDVRLVGFGVATCLAEGELRRAVEPCGTPPYQAPELARRRAYASCAADIWAFGIVALDLLLDRARPEPRAVDERRLRALLLEARLPQQARFENILAHCGEDDPRHRFANGNQLADALRALRVEPDLATRQPRAGILAAWRRAVVETGERLSPLNPQETARALALHVRPFVAAVLLASLPKAARREAARALEAGYGLTTAGAAPPGSVSAGRADSASLGAIVNALLVEHDPGHPAGRAALAVWWERTLASGRRWKKEDDVTLARGTLLENAVADPAEQPVRLDALLELLHESEIFSDYTLGRVREHRGRNTLVTYQGQAVQHGIDGVLLGEHVLGTPVLVRLTVTGRVDDDVPPLALQPFARFVGDGHELEVGPPPAPPPSLRSTPASDRPPAADAPEQEPAAPPAPPSPFVAPAPLVELSAQPVDAVRAGAFWHVLTEDGSWLLFDEEGKRVRLCEEPGVIARAIGLEQAAILVRYDATVVRIAGADVEYWALPAPVLAVAAMGQDVVFGTVAGTVEVRDENSAVIASASATEPVAEIAAVAGHGFVALGLHGGLWHTRWPAAALELEPLRGNLRDRVVGLFPTVILGGVGVVTMTSIGWLDVGTGSVRVAATGMECGARSVIELERGARAAVLGDDGELAIVHSSSLRSLRLPALLDKGPLIGASILGDQGVLAWTRSGALFNVSPTLSVRRVAEDGVALARHAGAQEVAVVHWRASRGDGVGPIAMARLTLGPLEAARRRPPVVAPEGPR